MANDNEMKNEFKMYEDHPMHRKAKQRELKQKPKPLDEAIRPPVNIVTCPECGVTFDSNIKISNTKDGDQ